MRAVLLADRLDAVEHHHRQAGEDGQQQEFVEALPGWRIGVEDDHIQAFAPALWGGVCHADSWAGAAAGRLSMFILSMVAGFAVPVRALT
ncbi:hypothetical protein D3C78_1289880 [compost metagenome]